MKFYRFWALGEAQGRSGDAPVHIRAYAGSNEDLADALQKARELAQQRVELFARGDGLPSHEYDYGQRPVREELIEEFADATGVYGVLSRNAYGALVLNTADVMFADVDYPKPSLFEVLRRWTADEAYPGEATVGFLRSVWNVVTGKSGPERDMQVVRNVHAVVEAHPGLGLRMYRTANGFRCLVTSRTFDPVSDEAGELLDALHSDLLYTDLCQAQECFRARVSPKPWRIGFERPPHRFPFASAQHESAQRAWEARYTKEARRYTACVYLASFGAKEIPPHIQSVVDLHDRLACNANAPLA